MLVDLADPDEQIVVRVVAGVGQFEHRRPDHVEVRGQRVAGERQDVGAPRQSGVVAVAALGGQQPATDGGRRVGGVVDERRRGRFCVGRRIRCGVRRAARRAAGRARVRASPAASRSGRATPHPEPARWIRTGAGRCAAAPPRWVPSHSRDSRITVVPALVIIWLCVHGPIVSPVVTPRLRSWPYCSRVCSRNRSCQPVSEQHRDVHALQRVAKMQSRPERVVGPWVFEPRLEPGRTLAEQRAAGLAERQAQRRLGHQPLGTCLPQHDAQPSRVFLAGDQVAPAQEVIEPNDPVPQRGPLTSCGPTVITAAFISGGGSASSAHCVKPR